MHHTLELSDATTVVGFIDKTVPPILSINSGDTVEFGVASSGGGQVTPATTLDELIHLLERNAPHAGGHSLTGPIAVVGAQPGQVLRVDILAIDVNEHGFNFQLPGSYGKGLLPEDFPTGRITHYNHDLADGKVELWPNVRVPLDPFLGFIAVCPAAKGPHHSVPPGAHGGNIDLRHARVGSSMFLPIMVHGALFYAGDAHATQGNGEVCLSAIETSFKRVKVKLSVLDRDPIARPRLETNDLWITMGIHEDLLIAAKQAVSDMIVLLNEEHDIPAQDAYTICSAAVNLSITQLVNGTKGVHAELPKTIFGVG